MLWRRFPKPREFRLSCLLKSIVILARELGSKTVAKQVADENLLAVVESLGIDKAQGFISATLNQFSGALRTHRNSECFFRPVKEK